MTLPNRTDHPITPLDSHHPWKCRWYGVRQDRIRLPDGTDGEYNVIELTDAVWVLPITAAGDIVLLYHYRYPLHAWGWELPSGSISIGDSALQTAQKELLEEAGGTATEWHFLLKASTMKGIGTEYAHLYLANGVILGATQHEPAEVMTVHTLPRAQVLAMARAGEIHDAMSVLALMLAFTGEETQ